MNSRGKVLTSILFGILLFSLTMQAQGKTYTTSATPASVSFSASAAGAVPMQSVSIRSNSPAAVEFEISCDQSWITLPEATGTTKTAIEISVRQISLAPGSYTGHVFIMPAGAGISPLTIPVTLKVLAAPTAPSIVTQPASQTIMAGQTATFSVNASGTAPFKYKWMKNGAVISSATSASYSVANTSTSSSGSQFSVTVSNASGNVTSNAATLTVNSPLVAPSITGQPTSQTVNAGQAATFSVAASGTAPLSYQWTRNGVAISGATSATYSTAATTAAQSGSQFDVTVSNAAGSATSNAAALTVATPPSSLSISQSSLSFANVNVGGSSVLSMNLTNSGTSNITVSNVTISGAGFTASGVSSGLILTPSQIATLNVTFAPAATGSVTGNVVIASNAANSSASVALSGTGAAPASHSASLGWSADSSTVAGYNIYRSAISGGPYTMVNGSLNASTTFTDTTVQAGQYYYVVTAVNTSGVESAYSSPVSALVP